MTPRRTPALARTAAEAVRSLNHATLGGSGLDQPADAYERPRRAVAWPPPGLPQLLAQVGRWLAAALAAGRLGCDDGADPAAAVSGAWLFISDARASAAALARDLGRCPAAARRRQRRPRTPRRRSVLMIDAVNDRFGLTRMPFGRDLPPSRLHRHADCAEAAARITWAVAGGRSA